MKARNKRVLSLLLALTMLFAMLPVSVAAAGEETLAEWTFADAGTPVTATGGVFDDSTFEHYSTVGTSSTLTLSYTGSNKTLWTGSWDNVNQTDKYWHITTKSTGYENLNVSFGAYGTSTSPKNFVVEYYDEGTSAWEEVEAYTLGAALASYSIDLPDETADLAELLLRFRVVDTESINGGTVSASGNSRMADIVITGTEIVNTSKAAAPTASIASGSTVETGATVSLSTTTSSANIYYTTDGSTPTNSSALYAGPITLTADVTIKAIAIDPSNTLGNSDVATFTYTVLTQVQSVTPSRADGAEVTSGAKIKFTAVPEGATIQYSYDQSAWADVPTAGLEITGNVGDNVTVYVRGIKTGLTDSTVLTLTYTIKAPSADPIDDSDIPTGAYDINGAIALADSTSGVTVVGQLAYRYGNYDSTNSAILQDVISGEIVAIQIYSSLDDYEIGDVLAVTGQKTTYGGVPQLQSVTNVARLKSAAEVLLIAPQEYTSLSALLTDKDDLLSEVVLLKNMTLGAYSSTGTTMITDSANATLGIYRAATYPIGVTEGEVVDVLAVVSKYSTTDQLRTGTPADNGERNIYDVVNDTAPPVITIPDPLADAEVYVDYALTVTVTDNKGVAKVELTYTVESGSAVTVEMTAAGAGKYTYTIPGTEITAGSNTISFSIKATDVSSLDTTSAVKSIAVKDEPQITAVTPVKGTATGADKRPEISAEFQNATVGTTAALTLTNSDGVKVVDGAAMTVTAGAVGGSYTASYTPASDMVDGKYTAKVVVTRLDAKTAEYEWYFTVGESLYNLYFGQLHSHTTYSDGSGTLDSALEYIKNYAANDNVDFVAFTDHSNYFDTSGAANPEAALYDSTQMTAASLATWTTYKDTMASFNADFGNTGILAIPGFEMTWSGGPGHINTFNTPGLVSRNNSTLNTKTNDSGMQAYYDLLVQTVGSISQFNHPGTTFGTFANFAYYTVARDEMITMVEVGNGEGAISSSGYFPSYEYYTQALDKGWHLAPTNNQDNHKGKWGNANTTRSVIITDDFSETGIYDAMRNMTMYSTEDKNLEIMYTLNGEIMGSTISTTPNTVNINVEVSDPDSNDVGGKIQVIVNGGLVAYEEAYTGSSYILEAELPASYSYYYIRVIQSDNDIAVTAPVWVGEVIKVGVTDITTDTVMPVKDEAMVFETSLYNYEGTDLTINKITYTETYLGTTTTLLVEDNPGSVTAGTSAQIFTLNYTPTKTGYVTITVNVEATLGSTPYVFEKNIEFEVLDPDSVIDIAIDAGHANFYVSGNYADSDAAFIEMCAMSGVRAVRLGAGALTYENLKDKALLVLTTPFLSYNTAVTSYLYTDAELAAIAQYASQGGNIVLCSKSDRGDPSGTGEQAAVITNGILAALGSDTEVGAAIVVDPDRKSNELYRITLGGNTEADQKVFNYGGMSGSELVAAMLKDVQENTNNTFSAYNSAPIIPGANAEVLVSGFPTTTFSVPFAVLPSNTTLPSSYTKVTDEGNTHLMTVEPLSGGGFLIVSGVTFFSTFEVKIDLDNVTEKQNSNYQLVQNIIDLIVPAAEVTDIADVQAADEGHKFTIEGVVTSNASGYDKDTAYFDCIYVQDETGGINIFPVDGNYQIGQTVRITGYTSAYNGERQLNISGGSITMLDASVKTVVPKAITTAQAANGTYLGSLVQVSGAITDYTLDSSGLVESIIVRDASGVSARIFIDGYISTNTAIANVAVGNTVTAIGHSSHDTEGYRIRISDRANITCIAAGSGGSSGMPIVQLDVIYYPNGGAGSSYTLAVIFGTSHSVRAVTDSSLGFTRDGYTFTGWNTKANGSGTSYAPGASIIVTGNVLLYAQWSADDTPPVSGELPFTDVKESDWFYDAVAYVYQNGLFAGTTDTTYAPSTKLNREMFVTVLSRLAKSMGEDISGYTLVFSDVTDGQWYSEAIAWGAAKGIVAGYDKDTFGLGDNITREQMAALFIRFAQYANLTLKTDADVSFADADSISGWAADDVNAAVAAGLFVGDNGNFYPQRTATRAEAAQVFMTFSELYVK